MKKMMITFLMSFLSLNAFADYALITCHSKSSGLTAKLSLDELSDISESSTHLVYNKKRVKVSKVSTERTDFGVLSLNVESGTGPAKFNFYFKNLGSSKCFGVYGSKQKGSATVDVVNSLGHLAQLTCKCDQD